MTTRKTINIIARILGARFPIRKARSHERRDYGVAYILCDAESGTTTNLDSLRDVLEADRERSMMEVLSALYELGVISAAGVSQACDKLHICQ